MNPAEKILTRLHSLLAHRERHQAVVRPARVLGRHEDGTERLQRLDATCITRGTPDNHYTSTIVLNPSLSTIHRTGTTGIPPVTEIVSAPTLWIERLDPSAYRPGQSYTVTVTGRGFDDRVRIEFLEPPVAGPIAQGQTINEDITVLSILVDSPELLHLEIAVAPEARLYPNPVPIAYGRK